MSSPSRRVLIADDSPTVRQVLCGALEATGFDVCGQATNGLEAIEQAVRSHPDLIVLDLSMPGVNGLQAARTIRNQLPSIPIILFTGYAEAVNVKDATSAGINSVIGKPDVKRLITEARMCLNA